MVSPQAPGQGHRAVKRQMRKREWALVDDVLREARRLQLAALPSLDQAGAARVTVEVMNAHFTKYHFGNAVALHHFTGVDLGDPHDHPGPFTTQIIQPYVEDLYTVLANGRWSVGSIERRAGTSHVVQASTIHQITALPDGQAWTLVRYGRPERATCFYRFGDVVLWRGWRQRRWRALPVTGL